MSRAIRSATLQMRVTPAIKFASEGVLRRLDLSMTEAIELFLRRMIVDQRIPFEVVAFDNATFARLLDEWDRETELRLAKQHGRHGQSKSRTQARPKRGQ